MVHRIDNLIHHHHHQSFSLLFTLKMASILEKIRTLTAGSNRKILHRINGTSLHQRYGVRPSSMLRACDLHLGQANNFDACGGEGVDDDVFNMSLDGSDNDDNEEVNNNKSANNSDDEEEEEQCNSDHDDMNVDDDHNDAEDAREQVSMHAMWEETCLPPAAGDKQSPSFSSLKSRILEIVYPRVEILVRFKVMHTILIDNHFKYNRKLKPITTL
jgi:hypothetical protein